MIRLCVMLSIALAAVQPGDANRLEAVAHLLEQNLDVHNNVDERCASYEMALKGGPYGSEFAHMSRLEVLGAIHDAVNAQREDGARVLSDVRQCMANMAAGGQPTAAGIGAFDRSQLVSLSKAHQDMRGLPLDQRCRLFDEQLRGFMQASKNPLASASKAALFQNAIARLNGRQLPFNNKQPFLVALEECVSNLSEYQSETGPKRNVISGPLPGAGVVPTAAGKNPIERAYDEFNSVKNNIKDLGQDLYNKVPAESHHNQGHHHPGNEVHGHLPQGAHHQSGALHFGNEVSGLLPAGFAHDHGRPLDELRYNENHQHNFDHHHQHNQNDKLSHELRLNQRHPFEHQNHHEHAQLHELEDRLRDQSRRAVSLEAQIEQYEMVNSELEKKVAELQRQLASAQEALQYGHKQRKNDDDDDDDDSDSDDDDDDRSIGDVIKHKKEQKKYKKDKKKGKKDDDDKVYKDPVDIARKLQDKMNSSESPESRCQKYYMALNYNGKVNKKLLKILSQLRLPKSTNQDQAYFDSLSQYAQLLAGSSQKHSQQASREIQQCLTRRESMSHSTSTQQRSLGPNEIPVIDARNKHHQHHADYARNQQHFEPSHVVNSFGHSSAQEIPVTFVNSDRPNVRRNWSYSRSSGGPAGARAVAFANFHGMPSAFVE